MAKKKPESHLIDGIGEQPQAVTPEPQSEPEWVISMQGSMIGLGNGLIEAQAEIGILKARVNALAKIVEQNWGKVI